VSDSDGFKLIIEDDEGRRSVVPVDLGEVSIGRLDGNTIRLNERNVSRRHARLFKDSSNVVAEDLDSYNGVFVNGDRIKGRQEIHVGDLIRIGDFQLELRGEGLQSVAGETTQRTQVHDIEATQPDVRFAQDSSSTIPDQDTEPDLEPTAIIRMAHMEDVEASRQKSAIAGRRAKLICVSSQFAGEEFEIKKTEVVIGRTEENDIAIDHRSVSRHHAKLITAGQSVKIVDLKSANGTLVNGEEYAQIDLKTGDLLELGHVKFRYVPPGAQYDFTPEELAVVQGGDGSVATPAEEVAAANTTQMAQPTTGGVFKANQLILTAIAGLAVAILVMVVWLARGDGEEASQVSPSDPAGELVQPAAPAASEPSANEAERQYAQAAIAFQRREWDTAATLARAALTYQPTHRRAQELVQQSESEARAQSNYDLGVAAINDNEWSPAWSHLEGIPPSSVYATQARALMDQVRAALVAQKVQEANTALQAEDWTAAEALADEIAALEPARPDAARIRTAAEEGRRRKTDKQSRKPRAKTPAKPAKAATAPPPPPPPPPPKQTDTDAKSLYGEGTKALRAGQFQRAIDKLAACIKTDRSFCLCYRAMGIAYARAGNGPKAYRYYKQYLKVCPTATDASAVEELLEQYENAQPTRD
jgi:pSer/pThr/pTyr-binding forkhead associated (FHA) protein/tetratricopeptide (TPR) repeat protein